MMVLGDKLRAMLSIVEVAFCRIEYNLCIMFIIIDRMEKNRNV